jgi:nucleoside-diphosphate-sugar epimerase
VKRVLVTGATGFIGRQCLPALLEHDLEVHAITSKRAPLAVPDVHWHRANLLEAARVTALLDEVQPSHLLHLAWFAKPEAYMDSPQNLAWVQASLHLLSAFHGCGGERVVTAGSCFEYDWSYGYCREQLTPRAPATLYGSSKHALRTVTEAFSQQVGLSSAWGHVFFLYGPHEHPARLVSYVTRSLLQGRVAKTSSGTQIRDFTHVEDVAGAFVALLLSDVTGPVNIASGQPVAVKDVIDVIAERLDKRHLVKRGAPKSRPDEPHLLVADVTRLRSEVGFRPHYELESGLEATIAWWRGQLAESAGKAVHG